MPWLKTVVKHEAFAARRQRERHSPVTDNGDVADTGTDAAATHEQAARYERLRQGAEAMGVLKPQEVRALLLKAEGYSYREICEITGWTYTKVNRCLTEGRRAFAEQVQGIQAGAECDRLAPLLSALVDGEAGAEDLASLRPHLKTCLSCRGRLREFRAAPPTVASLVPPVALVASTSSGGGGGLRGLVESLIGAAQHKTAALGERAHAAVEMATGPEAGGGGRLRGGRGRRRRGRRADRRARRTRGRAGGGAPRADAARGRQEAPRRWPSPRRNRRRGRAGSADGPRSRPRGAEARAGPGVRPRGAAAATPAASAAPATSPADAAFSPGGSAPSGAGAGGGGEFAP